ncbi:MAG TPA: three-Cys-motif partner protein TcmP [Thermoanaerobaculia bacterium]|nr:three-Cys-motif partner protein TcmP [Thermoanaerobaculia bacterium]
MITDRLDICYARDKKNYRALATGLRELDARLLDGEETLVLDAKTLEFGDGFAVETNAGILGCLSAPAGAGRFLELIQGASEMVVGSGPITVAALEDVIRLKRASGRPSDLVELEILAALREEIEYARRPSIGGRLLGRQLSTFSSDERGKGSAPTTRLGEHEVKFDKVGEWSELKIKIVAEYAQPFSTILKAQKGFTRVYIDAFSGPGRHISKKSGEFVPGSPLAVLAVSPPFDEYHFIDLDQGKLDELRRLVGPRSDVKLYQGDCNDVLLSEVFPTIRYEDYRRGLCLLDPYGLNLKWEVMQSAGRSQTIDMILNFPVADMNRNALWRDPTKVSADAKKRMTAFWGDDSWSRVAYTTKRGLFEEFPEKEDNETIARAFRKRLKEVAGFAFVSQPLPMRNSKGATVYYLFGASQKEVGVKIIDSVFKKHAQGRKAR